MLVYQRVHDLDDYFFYTIGKRTSLLLLDTVGIISMGMTVIYRGLMVVIVIVSKVLIYHPNFLGKLTGKLPNSNKHVVGKLIKLGFTNLLG